MYSVLLMCYVCYIQMTRANQMRQHAAEHDEP
jgi:hypothetical protein